LLVRVKLATCVYRRKPSAGWTLLRAKYDDGGFSGGNTDRPALQRLLDDVRAGKIDVIVVYKVDRSVDAKLSSASEKFGDVDRIEVTFVHPRPQGIDEDRYGKFTSMGCQHATAPKARSVI
jgi:DNA invertase Pin-like site-specific DNA recombinase